MALEDINIDINNINQPVEGQSVEGTRNETTNDFAVLTEEEKRIEIMNTLITNQKYHNMLEVCSKLKIDLNGLIIMNMDPTELANLNRSNVQNIVDEALESTRKFISNNTTGLVLHSDGTVNVPESIAEAVDRGGIFTNDFIDPAITSQVRALYQEKMDDYLGKENTLKQLYSFMDDYKLEFDSIGNGFKFEITRNDFEEFSRIYRTYGKAALDRSIVIFTLDKNREKIAENPDLLYVDLIKNEYECMKLELARATNSQDIRAIRSYHERNVRNLRLDMEHPEQYLEETSEGVFELKDDVESLVANDETYDLEMVRIFGEVSTRLQKDKRPFSYSTLVQGAIFSYLVSQNVNGLDKYRDSNLARISNLAPQLIKYEGNKPQLDEEALKHFFDVLYPDINFEGNTIEKIKFLTRETVTNATSVFIKETINKKTDEITFEEERADEAAQDQIFKLSSLDTQTSTLKDYSREEIINELATMGRLMAQRQFYIKMLNEKHKGLNVNDEFARGILSGNKVDSRLDQEDMDLLERIILSPGERKREDIILNEWMNSEVFRSAFSNAIKRNEETGRFEIDFEVIHKEYDRRRASLEINGHVIGKEEIRKELIRRIETTQKDKKNRHGKVTNDTSMSYLSRFNDEELIAAIRDQMPDFYNSITTSITKNTLDCISLKALKRGLKTNKSLLENRKRMNYKYVVDNKVYNAIGIAKLFYDSFQELKSEKSTWEKDKDISMESSEEELIKHFPGKEEVIRRLMAAKAIMEDFDNFESFSNFFETNANKINIGRLQRIMTQMLENEEIKESEYMPQNLYDVKGRRYSKIALVTEYLDIMSFKDFSGNNYFEENEDKIKMMEDIIKKSPEFKQYLNPDGSINIDLLNVYKTYAKMMVRADQFGFISRPDDIKVSINGKEYKQVEIPSIIVKLTRSEDYEKNKSEISQLIEYVKGNPDIYGKEVSESLKDEYYNGDFSPELAQLADAMNPKYTVDRVVLSRDEVIRMLAEKHFGNETDDNTKKEELYQFHKSGDIGDIPIRLLETMVVGKYGKEFADIITTDGQRVGIDWNKVIKEYDTLTENIDGRIDKSKTIYKFAGKNYTAEGIMVQYLEYVEKERELSAAGLKGTKEQQRAERLMSNAYKILMNPKNYGDFGEFIEYTSKNGMIGITNLRKRVEEIKRDPERLKKCKPIDDKELGKHFKKLSRQGEEVRLFDLEPLNKILDRNDTYDAEAEYGHSCRSVKKKAEDDKSFRRIQNMKIYGTSKEIAERLYKEVSAQAICRREKNKDEFVVSSLMDICDELKKTDPEMAKFIIPGIVSRIGTNLTRYKELDMRDSNSYDIAIGLELTPETFERFYKERSLVKNQSEEMPAKDKVALRSIKAKIANEQRIDPYRKMSDKSKIRIQENLTSFIARRIGAEEEITVERYNEFVQLYRQEIAKRRTDTIKAYEDTEARKREREKEEALSGKTKEQTPPEKPKKQAPTPKSKEITDREVEQASVQEPMNVDEDFKKKAAEKVAKAKAEERKQEEAISQNPITDREAEPVLQSKREELRNAEVPQRNESGEKIEGQETSDRLSGQREEKMALSDAASKEDQTSSNYGTNNGGTESGSTDTTSTGSDAVHEESTQNNLPAKDSVFNRIKRGFISFINRITGKEDKGPDEEIVSDSVEEPVEPSKADQTVGEPVDEFSKRLQYKGANGKVQESDLKKTDTGNAKDSGNPNDKKAEEPVTEIEEDIK